MEDDPKGVPVCHEFERFHFSGDVKVVLQFLDDGFPILGGAEQIGRDPAPGGFAGKKPVFVIEHEAGQQVMKVFLVDGRRIQIPAFVVGMAADARLLGFAVVIIKCLLEVLMGKGLFAFLYFGLAGDPVAVTHAGGALGGAVAWLCFRPKSTNGLGGN